MPRSPGVLSLRALNRALLSRQLLLRPEPMPAIGAHNGTARAGRVIETVEHLVGLQAQAPFPPYYGLWSRLAGFRPDDLAGLILSRQVVRIALMRGTIHLVSARDCLMLRPLVQPALDRGLGPLLSRQLAGVDTAALAAAPPGGARPGRPRAGAAGPGAAPGRVGCRRAGRAHLGRGVARPRDGAQPGAGPAGHQVPG